MRAACILALALLAGGCDTADTPSGTENETKTQPAGITRITEEGPVKAEVTLTPAAPRLGDPLTLQLTVTTAPGVILEMPAFGEALGRFSILDFAPRVRDEADGSSVATQTYTLQAPMSGQQRIPPLRLEYLDGRPGHGDNDNNDTYRELLTEELSVHIASVLAEGRVSDTLKPARAALPELKGSLAQRLWPVLLAGLLIIAVVIWLAGVWQKRAHEQARLTAFDRAYGRLGQLEQRGLPSGDAVDAWYVELSDIVRRYIEDQFRVRAPELTTEEFLAEAQKSAQLSAPHRALLSEFLERCDRVKFAAYAPGTDESLEAITLARRFLGETRVDNTPAEQLAA